MAKQYEAFFNNVMNEIADKLGLDRECLEKDYTKECTSTTKKA